MSEIPRTFVSKIRVAVAEDAEGISRVILSALRETNSLDYSSDIIARVEQSFFPKAILALIEKRTVYVALIADQIVGTASLDGDVVRSVFVAPQMHASGIGRSLMHEIETEARVRGITRLTVPSSVTAEIFYEKLGYRAVRQSYHGDERTIIMERSIASEPSE